MTTPTAAEQDVQAARRRLEEAEATAAAERERLAEIEARERAAAEAAREKRRAALVAEQRRQPTAVGPHRAAFDAAIRAGDLAAAFAAFRDYRRARSHALAANEVLGASIMVPDPVDPQKWQDWLTAAITAADQSDRTELAAELSRKLRGDR